VTSYLDLDDFVETAAELLALPDETVVKKARLDLEETFQRMRAIAGAPPRTWKRSRPRSPAGSSNGCVRLRGRLTDRSDEAIMDGWR
jgi:hypothetical protein